MDCNCEKAPEFPTKTFIPGPIEIPINFRAVTIPADQGDDVANPPQNGAYRNVVLKYAANGHTYIYSSDGIPVMLVGSITFNSLPDRPKYDGQPMTSYTDIPNVTGDIEDIEGDIEDINGDISDINDKIAALATDFSYKGSVEDYAHLPSDAATGDVYTTTDTGLIYVWDGTQWVALNKTVDVVQTKGTSQTSVMSQDAVSKQLYGMYNGDYDGTRIQIGSGSVANTAWGVAIGSDSHVNVGYTAAIGHNARSERQGSVALGAFSQPSSIGEVNIGLPRATSAQVASEGHNNTPYRLLTGLADPENGHDAVTKEYTDARIIQNAGAPTTSTVGTVGQLLEDTTNGKLYQCTAVTGDGGDPEVFTYTWTEVQLKITPVQTRGTSTTDVMSQNATSKLVYENPTSDNSAIRITTNPILSVPAYAGSVLISQGANAKAANNSVAIGLDVRVDKNSGIAIGSNSYSAGNTGKGEIAIGVRATAHTESSQFGPNIALGANALAHGDGNIALGYGAESKYGYDSLGNDLQGVLSLEKQAAYNTTGFNDSQYMLIKGVYDPQEAHDAATKGYADTKATITMTSTDPGEGGSLAANNFIAVYNAS